MCCSGVAALWVCRCRCCTGWQLCWTRRTPMQTNAADTSGRRRCVAASPTASCWTVSDCVGLGRMQGLFAPCCPYPLWLALSGNYHSVISNQGTAAELVLTDYVVPCCLVQPVIEGFLLFSAVLASHCATRSVVRLFCVAGKLHVLSYRHVASCGSPQQRRQLGFGNDSAVVAVHAAVVCRANGSTTSTAKGGSSSSSRARQMVTLP